MNLTSRPVVIGMGPAGLFAGLILAQSWASARSSWSAARRCASAPRTPSACGAKACSIRNPTCSSAKAARARSPTASSTARSRTRKHHGRKVLTEFVKAGAPAEILYVSKPHIGTFRLVSMVENMRATIEALGGEIRFQSRVDDIEIDNGQVRGVVLASGERIASRSRRAGGRPQRARHVPDAPSTRGVYIEAKPFSIGFRIEHPQSLIDRCRFGKNAGNPLLGAADYKLVHHCSNGRSVYSFCMCPGGTVVAAASEPGRVVTNGMSQYSRNERNANSGIVVGITPEDYPGDPLAGIAFQRHWEERAFELGGSNYDAPGQLVGDFLAGKPSTELRLGAAVLHARRASVRSQHRPAGLRDRGDPRGAARLRQADQGLCHARCGADRRRDAHLLADPHQRATTISRASTPRPLSRRRRRRLCRRHSFRARWTASRSPRPWLTAC